MAEFNTVVNTLSHLNLSPLLVAESPASPEAEQETSFAPSPIPPLPTLQVLLPLFSQLLHLVLQCRHVCQQIINNCSERHTETAAPALPHPPTRPPPDSVDTLRLALPKSRFVWQAIGRQDGESRLHNFLLLLLFPLLLFPHSRHSEEVHREHPNLSLHLAQHPPLPRPVKRVAEAQLPCFEPRLLHERPCTLFQPVGRFDQAMNEHIKCIMSRFWIGIVEISNYFGWVWHSVDSTVVKKGDCQTWRKGWMNSRRIVS
ncbi:hypothetical protein BLNAU_4334 [Blattamonas nauphoetae]|uniref:Uncharacterized protein n=1 Tax=Blattamonas nauphoetae TaxID=2049346 RepID=A0ABQ9YAM8_9EUKA|nr:hypothetical protein BLNAU_4334 [Blattamonas nauphoetae]